MSKTLFYVNRVFRWNNIDFKRKNVYNIKKDVGFQEVIYEMLEMDEKTFIDFYKNTVDEYNYYVKRLICSLLEEENKITYEEQIKLADDACCKYFPEKIMQKLYLKQFQIRLSWHFMINLIL